MSYKKNNTNITVINSPLVSVVMAVCNGERHLRDAIDSLMAQTCLDVEFIVIDDGSTDGTAAILTSYQDDPRFVLVTNPANMGLPYSLNLGLTHARGQFIARMDADDVALPERLERQVTYLRQHPDIGLLGLFSVKIDNFGTHVGPLTPPVKSDEVLWESLFINPFHHPGAMFRRALLQQTGPYNEELITAQDFDLFTRMLAVTVGENLPEFLLLYRVHPCSVTTRRRKEQLQVHDRVMQRSIQQITGHILSSEQVHCLRNVIYDIRDPGEQMLSGEETVELYITLLKDALASGRFGNPTQVVARAMLRILLAWYRHGFAASWVRYLVKLSLITPWVIPATVPLCLRIAIWRLRGR